MEWGHRRGDARALWSQFDGLELRFRYKHRLLSLCFSFLICEVRRVMGADTVRIKRVTVCE